jgi:hypothetical protein
VCERRGDNINMTKNENIYIWVTLSPKSSPINILLKIPLKSH